MYFLLCPRPEGAMSWLYCSGVSSSRFLPITRGRHGLASNPAMRGLQLTDLHLRKECNDHGARTSSVKGNPCDVHVPKGGDWYRQLLFIDDASAEVVEKLVSQCPVTLVGSIFQACMVSDYSVPAVTPPAEEFERFLEDVCAVYSRQAGWPTTASAKGFRK